VGGQPGTVLGGLIGLGIPEEEATRYEAEFHAGRALVTVDAGVGRALEAAEILNRHGAGMDSPATDSPAAIGSRS